MYLNGRYLLSFVIQGTVANWIKFCFVYRCAQVESTEYKQGMFKPIQGNFISFEGTFLWYTQAWLNFHNSLFLHSETWDVHLKYFHWNRFKFSYSLIGPICIIHSLWEQKNFPFNLGKYLITLLKKQKNAIYKTAEEVKMFSIIYTHFPILLLPQIFSPYG